MRIKILPPTAALFLFAMTAIANAQPSVMVPGAPNSYPYNQALPPLPFTAHSPMPSLPPPSAEEVPPPPSFGSGRTVGRAGFSGRIHNDGRLIFDSKVLTTGLSSDPVTGPRAFGIFDLTDLLSRDDPYAWQKLDLLEETFERRAALSKHHRAQVGKRAIDALPAYLTAVWRQEWDAQTRRQLLFALWDECAEGNASNAEEGAEARAIILAFIDSELPSGSRDGFRQDELAMLNTLRTSSSEFAPR
tara:strand:- start:45318 stop:46055 length:738 start_codon:yes stop_codon:yes gene_type:complete